MPVVAGADVFRKKISCAITTSDIEIANTIDPIALIWGSVFPWRISRIITGTVLFRPETNHATANSSKDTAAVRQKADAIAGRQNGMITSRMARHGEAPRFQAAGSRSGLIWASRIRTTAIANGAHKTTWLTTIE